MAGEDSDREQAGGGDAKDNQIANETLVRLQFLVDSIPEIKARLLAVGGEEPTTASGRKRLYVLYQALCDTFPDESDVAFARRVSVKTPTGAVERKASDKRKRKRESKTRERKEKRKRKTAPKQNIVATASAEMDANALVREATADEESGYQQDIVKIRAMEKRAGFAGADDSKGKSTSKKAKRAANKKGQQKQRPQAASADEAPMLVPISSSAAPTGAPAANGCTGRRSSSPGPWVVRDKDPVGAVAGAQGRSQPEGLTSLLSAIDKLVIVRDKAPALVSGAAPGPRAAPSGKAATATRSGRGGRRLMWALEQNSVKRFLKKVPMLPSPEPTPGATHMLPKPVLRKDSAYGKCDLPLLPAEPSAARTKKGGRASKKARPQPRRNEHANELGNAVPTAPFFFLKPVSSYVASPGVIEIPPGCVVHHEVELGVVIGKAGRCITAANAMDHVAGYALGLDLTARNLQDEAKKKGLPWSAAKGFDTFTPIGPFIPKSRIPDPHRARLWIDVAGQVKQDGSTDAMLFRR
ncbi:hypothetical protein LPJ61_006015, partial [Coemansia biformis]